MDLDDLQPKKAKGPALGEPLTALSIAELEARLTLLSEERLRVEQELGVKRAAIAAAAAIFKS
jgi:uncharacterized small protein (DUF1192 family)